MRRKRIAKRTWRGIYRLRHQTWHQILSLVSPVDVADLEEDQLDAAFPCPVVDEVQPTVSALRPLRRD